jgi:hypothetical protein
MEGQAVTAYSDLRALRRKGYTVARAGNQLEVARDDHPPDPERALAWLRPRKAALLGALDAETECCRADWLMGNRAG